VFAGLIHKAKSAAMHASLKYVARAAVAIPFIIGLGFVVAAIATMLVERFGNISGYWMMSGGLMVLGVVAAIAVWMRERGAKAAGDKAENAQTREARTRAAFR
jgi:uncharacterized membrane protein